MPEPGQLAVADGLAGAGGVAGTRSNVVACENIPHVGIPSDGQSVPSRASHEQAAGCAGAP